MKKLWRTLNGVRGDATTSQTDALTADDFAAFFRDKFEVVHSSTATMPQYDVPFKPMSGMLSPSTRLRH